MGELNCRWNGSDNPRTLSGRHGEDCADRYSDDEHGCRGCLPCPGPHCRVCGRAHAAATCAECLAETREALHEIGRMCDALPEEVEHRGIDGEAMMLLGPAANPEARGHLEASVLAGRVSSDALEASHIKGCDDPRCVGCAGELHPQFVLGRWEDVWRDALDHDQPEGLFELAATVDYLDRTLTYMGGFEHVPFEDFARDLRRCVAHLEAVLHDGEQRDEGVPCLRCQATLLRVWGDGKRDDGWECPRCHERSTDAQYRFAVKADYIQRAEWLTDVDMVVRFAGHKLTAGTVRSWAVERTERPAVVKRRRHSERTEYCVADVGAQLAKREVA